MLSLDLAAPRSQSRASIAASGGTYHSFNDAHVYEPVVPPTPSKPLAADAHPANCPKTRPREHELGSDGPTRVRRHDSGYAPSDTPKSRRRTFPSSFTSSSSFSLSSAVASPSTASSRPAICRSPKSDPVVHLPTSSAQLSHQQAQSAFVHFPHFTLSEFHDNSSQMPLHGCRAADDSTTLPPREASPRSPAAASLEAAYSAPPQTTHYWMSDQTRRLEYAAIDAATKGVKGWILRLAPDCFIPKDKRCIRLDDDRGSVRRYRLDLDGERADSRDEKDNDSLHAKGGPRKKAWWSSRDRRRSMPSHSYG